MPDESPQSPPPRPAADTARRIWRALGWVDKVFLALLLGSIVAAVLQWSPSWQALLRLATMVFGGASGLRWMRVLIRRSIWRLRNRLIVTYVFIGFVPIVLIALLVGLGILAIAGQTAVYLASSEFERRLEFLDGIARGILRIPAEERGPSLLRAGAFFETRYPGIRIVATDGGKGRWQYPPGVQIDDAPAAWGDANGVVLKDGQLYQWARTRQPAGEVTILAPITRGFLSDIAQGMGEVSFVSFSNTRTQGQRGQRRVIKVDKQDFDAFTARDRVPPPVNSLDMEVLWGAPIRVDIWEDPTSHETAILGVHSRVSAVMKVVFSQKSDWDQSLLLKLLYAFGVFFLIVEIVSLVIGINLTRSITSSIHELYEGTQRVTEGDFSHRIRVRGKDQLADLGHSFNHMTENLERLLKVAKEKERMQAELEIASEVQLQLYPRRVPNLQTLRLCALCHPARMVSGDYYDYQALSDGRAAIALGDVAGKGISAALLMANVQSALRTQLRTSMEAAATVSGPSSTAISVSTSRLVSHINQHLYANTSPEKFATLCIGVYDDAASVLTYTNAGHLPPILVRDGRAERLEVNGMVVGAFPFAKYQESKLEMQPGDLLVFFTDGISEPENEYGEMFGEDRLADLLVKNADRGESEIMDLIIERVREWTGSPELQDDMTLLLARRI